MKPKKQIYLPGLNGVRFIAAFLVILDHIELFKGYLGFKSLWPELYSSYLGSLGVTIFFTLSGFLITYLLLQEKAYSNGEIDIRKFYIRRILRIWPLYYLILILSFFILPYFSILEIPQYSSAPDGQTRFWPRFLFFLFLMPNVAFAFYPTLPFGNVLWSVGVEEQFYLFWPWLVKKIKQHIIKIAFVCLAIYMIIRWSFTLHLLPNSTPQIIELITRTRFSCMLIGAIAAGCVHFGFLKTRLVQWMSLIVFLAMLVNIIDFKFYSLVKSETQSVIIAIILINIAFNPDTIFRLENKLTNYLGKISYGLYVYHSIAAAIIIKLLSPLSPGLNYGVWSLLIILLTTSLAVLMSHISYFYFEKKLLDVKVKYSVVVSGDQVEPELSPVKKATVKNT